MINNGIKEIKLYHNNDKNISYIKYEDIGYEIGNNIKTYNKDEIDSLITIETLSDGHIIENCKFEYFIIFMKEYIDSLNSRFTIQQIIDNFHLMALNKDFILDRPKCFSQQSKLVRIKKNGQNEYQYYFKHENERHAIMVNF